MHLIIFPRHLSEAVETNSVYSTSITEAHKADLGVIVQSKSNPVSASGSGDCEQYVHGSSKRWSTAYVHEPCMHQGTPGGGGGGGGENKKGGKGCGNEPMEEQGAPGGGGGVVRASIMADSPHAEL